MAQRRLAMAVALGVALAALGESLPVASAAPPAVVRIIAPETGAVSYGSGALVAVTEYYGLVVTNWHVVRDATGPLYVDFPGGFRSPARLLKTDRDWDLAALAIWRPPVEPLTVATEAPRPGDRLTIAGYGPGWYRAMSGRCTQYVSPGGNHGFEMVELEAPARNGDSGGPIFNDRGEIAGILFGSAFGRTTGSYCGRLRWFLAGVKNDFYGIPAPGAMLAAQPSTPRMPVANPGITGVGDGPAHINAPVHANFSPAYAASLPAHTVPSHVADTSSRSAPSAACPAAIRAGMNAGLPGLPPGTPPASGPISYLAPPTQAAPVGNDLIPADWYEPVRNFLAVVGAMAVLLLGLKLISYTAR
jgi:hypothetical protein